ncbi:MAG: GAF domain-containing protein [Anaerolineales bacterium]|jgi:GAF domain-containing protein
MFTAMRKFFTAPHYEGDPTKTQDARTTHRVAIAMLGLAAFSVPFILRLDSPLREYTLYATVGGAFIWLIAIGLIKRRQVNYAKLIILIVNTLNLLAITYATGGFSRPTITTTLFLLALATLLFPRRGAINYGIFILVLSTILFFLGRTGLVPEPTYTSDDLSTFLIFSFTLVASASLLAISASNVGRNLELIREREIELRDQNITLNELTEQLEMRVEERTAELEQSAKQLQKRAAQFETITQLARTINSIQDPELLLQKVTQLVSVSFGFYHVGLFLLDESGLYAVLNAANSEGGQKMLDRRHRLKVGSEGIVGDVTSTGNPRIALDTGVDAVYFDNPDLPETHSEMALPLRVGTTIVGALDVQSTVPNAFTEDDVEVLSILADVISVAIENARLFEESQRVLTEAQTAFGEFTQEAWQKMVKSRKVVGYELSGTTIRSLEEPLIKNGSAIAIPIKLREREIGTMSINLPNNKKLSPDETEITQALVERVGIAIENATLLEETKRAAVKEQIIGEITGKIGSSINLRNVLQTAVEELGHVIPGSEIVIHLDSQKK